MPKHQTRPTERQYGLGFSGYQSSSPKHRVRLDALSGDSVNLVYSPSDQSFVRRSGKTIQNDTLAAGVEVSGILESKWGARSRRVFEFSSPSFDNGYPTYAALYGKEDPSPGYLDDGRFGTIAFYHPNASAYRQLGEHFGTARYPYVAGGGSASTNPLHKYWVMNYDSGEGGYTRGAFEFARRFLAAGSRTVRRIGDWLYLPNFHATPAKLWCEFDDSASGTDVIERYMPYGLLPPLFPPTLSTPAADAFGVWEDGDSFYVSVINEDEYGAFGPAFEPRAPVEEVFDGDPTVAFGWGLVTVGTPGGTNKYAAVTLNNVAIGYFGTRRRLVLRSKKIKRSSATGPMTGVSPAELYVCGIIGNNSQTSFTLTNADDLSLVKQDTIFRIDHSMPPPARYNFTFDQRHGHAYAKASKPAIIVAPVSINTAYDRNIADDNSPGSTNAMLVRVTSTAIVLRSAFTAPVVPNDTTITLANKTLAQVVDEINLTLLVGGGTPQAKWVAQLAPGAEPNDPATSLLPSYRQTGASVSGTSGNDYITTTDPTLINEIALGMKVRDSGNVIPADTIVLKKATNGRIYLGTVAGVPVVLGGNFGPSVTDFWFDTGDDGCVSGASNRGNMRAFCPTISIIIYYKNSARVQRTYKSDVYFTASGPNESALGISLAPDLWVVGNRKLAPGGPGIVMGAGEFPDGALIAYSRGIYHLQNRRGGTTGEDFDYRFYAINKRRGCNSPWGFVEGDGWCAYPTVDGIICVDSSRQERMISRDIFNRDRGLGNLVYEIGQCIAAVAKDSDTQHLFMDVIGSAIHVRYRSSGSVSRPDMRLVYDFSESAEASGIAEIVTPDGRPWGWSSQLSGAPSAMAEIHTSSGVVVYGAFDSNGGTGDGRIDKIDSGTSDNGDGIGAAGYCATDLMDSLMAKTIRRLMTAMENNNTGNCFATVYVDFDRVPAGSTTLAASTASPLLREIPIPATSRRSGPCLEVAFGQAAIDEAASRWYGFTADVEVGNHVAESA